MAVGLQAVLGAALRWSLLAAQQAPGALAVWGAALGRVPALWRVLLVVDHYGREQQLEPDEPALARQVIAERAAMDPVEQALLHMALLFGQPMPARGYRDASP